MPRIESCIQQEDWDVVRTRLQRIRSPKRIWDLISNYSANLPDDVLESLLDLASRYGYKYKASTKVSSRDPWSDTFLAEKFCRQRSASFLEHFFSRSKNLRRRDYSNFIRARWGHARASYNTDEWSDSICKTELEQSTDENVQGLLKLWRKIEVIIKSVGGRDSCETLVDEIGLVSSMIVLDLPVSIVSLAMRLYPEAISSKDKKYGRIPLHWAAVHNCNMDLLCVFLREKIELSEEKSESNRKDLQTMVELLLQAFPEGASYEDKEGLLPLDLLLEEDNFGWTTKWATLAMARHNPSALTRTSPRHPNMLPFMIVARSEPKYTWYFERHTNLQLTYALLCLDPSVLNCGLASTGKQRKNKLQRANGRLQLLKDEKRKQGEMVAPRKSMEGESCCEVQASEKQPQERPVKRYCLRSK